MRTNQRNRCWMPCRLPVATMALALAGTLNAGVVATNGDVPAAMNATGGTETDPKIYRFNAGYVKDFETALMSVGNATGANWVRLEVTDGAKVTATNTAYIGSNSSSFRTEFNSAWVSGAGSAMTLGATRLGPKSALNTLGVTDGGTLTLNGEVRAGYENSGYDSTNNAVIVDGGTLNVNARLRVGYGVSHDYCTIVVRNGGLLAASTTGRIGIRGGNYCDYRVEGEGSVIEIAYTGGGAISLGEMSTCHHNTLTVADGGVCKLTNSGGTLTISVDANQGSSGVRFAAGVFAVAGNRTTHVPANRAWLWDGNSWEPAPNDWTGTYYADETAAAAAGFAGFGGYTVFTGGKSLTGGDRATLVVIR